MCETVHYLTDKTREKFTIIPRSVSLERNLIVRFAGSSIPFFIRFLEIEKIRIFDIRKFIFLDLGCKTYGENNNNKFLLFQISFSSMTFKDLVAAATFLDLLQLAEGIYLNHFTAENVPYWSAYFTFVGFTLGKQLFEGLYSYLATRNKFSALVPLAILGFLELLEASTFISLSNSRHDPVFYLIIAVLQIIFKAVFGRYSFVETYQTTTRELPDEFALVFGRWIILTFFEIYLTIPNIWSVFASRESIFLSLFFQDSYVIQVAIVAITSNICMESMGKKVTNEELNLMNRTFVVMSNVLSVVQFVFVILYFQSGPHTTYDFAICILTFIGSPCLLCSVLCVLSSELTVGYDPVEEQKKFAKRDLVYLVRGLDEGKDAWYYIEVEEDRKELFLKALNDDVIHLETYGKIIYSGFGEEPPAELTRQIVEEYGMIGAIDKSKKSLELSGVELSF